ncbi:MAG: glycosyltransferase [Bacteroidota bacterium]
MKLVLIEFDYHAEVLRDTCLLLSKAEVDVYLLTTDKIWRQVALKEENLPRFTVNLVNRRSKIPAFVSAKLDEIHKMDLVLLNTLASHYQYFARTDFRIPLALRIHNTQTYLGKKVRFDFGSGWQDWKYNLRHIFGKSIGKLDWYYRKKFLQKVNFFVFPSRAMVSFAQNNHQYASKVNDIVLPLTFYHPLESEQHDTKSRVSVVIPGTVEKKRRDYKIVVEALRSMDAHDLGKIALCLLGKIDDWYGREILNELLGLEGLEVRHFSDFVPQDAFEQAMRRADFLLLPLQSKARYQIYREYYGSSKISGGESAMIKYGKPAMIPSFYKVDDALTEHALFFDSANELRGLLEKAASHKTEASDGKWEQFGIEKTARKTKEILESLVEKDKSAS